ncbi:Uncharacterised protein [Mycobacteroides abscessus subsp. abscessus]|nr:Uncharacterised protein [Mycobacteroides abscessus subsp. abscessus]SLF04392.1 Uncharacterised protein [Mycobacteroides abscessus subsp. abscessus]SLF79161.1 Uncharacterised protein [Mycobacteroides abscessus subsp. abscessus]SLH41771.1 Uncharacterised protein [Mycobacteroides abscessus subsp. abscessus]
MAGAYGPNGSLPQRDCDARDTLPHPVIMQEGRRPRTTVDFYTPRLNLLHDKFFEM